MQKPSWKDTVELVGIAAIIASLVFVGLELRQTREIAVADAYQARAELMLQAQGMVFDSDRLADILDRAFTEEISESDRKLVDRFQSVLLTYYENNHYQYQIGMLSEEHWASSLHALRNGVVHHELLIDLWREKRTEWRESFAEVIDELAAQSEETRRGGDSRLD